MLRQIAGRAIPSRSSLLLKHAPRNTSIVNRAICNASTFATNRQLQSQAKPGATKQTPKHEPGEPELPKFSLDGLGLSRNMKTALIVILGIFGTIETWVWCKAIWRWWNGEGFALRGKPTVPVTE